MGLSDRLNESHLAKSLKVSRTPIREAIRRLQQEQLLTPDSPDGIRIVEISLASAIHLYDCRIALERLAVEGACRHASKAQIKALEQNLVNAEPVFKHQLSDLSLQPANPTEQSLRQLALNYEFHRLIAESSQNLWLVSLLEQLSNQVKLLRLQILQVPVDVQAIQAEHEALLQAIIARDVEAATHLTQQHLELSQQRIISIFEHPQRAFPKAVVQSNLLCPDCSSPDVRKNGRRQGKQKYLCKQCGRQFMETTALPNPPI